MPEVWKLNQVHVLALGCAGAALGNWLQRRIPGLARWNIPGPVVGGLVYATATLLLRDRWLNFEIDTGLRDLLMLAFFTTVGFQARVSVLREGGRDVVKLLALAAAGAFLQGVFGIAVARALQVDLLAGLVTGPLALAGGPATSLAFGRTFEDLGLPGATAMATASAVFGIVVAGLFAGPMGGWLIRRDGLRGAMASAPQAARDTERGGLLTPVLLLGVAMGLGTLVSTAIESTGIKLPGYIGAMIVAAAIVNLHPRIPAGAIGEIGSVALAVFIVMALLTLKLWELAALAGPVVVLLAGQTAFTLLLTLGAYRVLGRTYDGAVTAAGFAGFMLGITANALAAMEELRERYGAAPAAFLAVPLVGAFLMDFTNSLVITAFVNWLR